jgi:hypothetical protein
MKILPEEQRAEQARKGQFPSSCSLIFQVPAGNCKASAIAGYAARSHMTGKALSVRMTQPFSLYAQH